MSFRIRGTVIVLSLAMGVPAFAQSSTSTVPAKQAGDKAHADQVARERDNLPMPALMDSIQKALGEKPSLQLSADQSRQIAATNDAFEKEIKDFIRTHADGKGADAPIPSRDAAEKRVLDLLNKDQRTAAEKALRDTASQRVSERHHEKHSSSHNDKKSGGDKNSSWQSSSSSQSSSESSSDKGSSSQHSSKSDHTSSNKSDNKSGKQSDSKSDHKSSSGSEKKHKHDSSAAASPTWSKLDDAQKKAALKDLLNQLPPKDREELSHHLKSGTRL